ncbi:unnamed protein product, partial [Polarella glacialis]
MFSKCLAREFFPSTFEAFLQISFFAKMAGGCAIFCTIMSAIAVPLLLFFGALCSYKFKSPMIDIPEHMKADAGMGCYMAGTFLYAYSKMQNAAEKPPSERLEGFWLPWRVADLGDNGLDATKMSYQDAAVLSISTVEHIGYDNEGNDHAQGFRIDGTAFSLEPWVLAWDASPALVMRIAREAREFLITFPIGFNPRLDSVVSKTSA